MIRLFRFAVGGAIGFLVDTGVLYALLAWSGLGPYGARVPSFLAAATATWLVNRHWTFADRRTGEAGLEWGRWLVAMVVGGVLNYLAYAALMAGSETVRDWPVLGVAAGSLAGMTVNFLSANYWIFRDKTGTGDQA